VHVLIFLGIFITTVTLPAYMMLGYWFLLQVLGESVSALQAAGGGVAFAAHVGGFVTGALLVTLFKNPALLARREELLSSA
jgi:membrane associated rhomboid family serine protease